MPRRARAEGVHPTAGAENRGCGTTPSTDQRGLAWRQLGRSSPCPPDLPPPHLPCTKANGGTGGPSQERQGVRAGRGAAAVGPWDAEKEKKMATNAWVLASPRAVGPSQTAAGRGVSRASRVQHTAPAWEPRSSARHYRACDPLTAVQNRLPPLPPNHRPRGLHRRSSVRLYEQGLAPSQLYYDPWIADAGGGGCLGCRALWGRRWRPLPSLPVQSPPPRRRL